MSTEARKLECDVEREGDVAILRPGGDIDLATAPELRNLGTGLVEQGVRWLALDLSGVSFLDSTGLGILVVILKRLRDKQGGMVLFSAKEQIQSLLQMTGLSGVFQVEPDESAARRFLAAG